MEGLGSFIELGAIGIFVWYAYQNNKEWRRYLTERNSKMEKALNSLVDEHKRNTDELKDSNNRMFRHLEM